MAVGDIHSEARGTGARFNDGKMPIHHIPPWIIAKYEREQFEGDLTHEQQEALDVLGMLGDWQRGLCSARDVLAVMDDPWMDCAAVFEYGARKYAPNNWCKGMPWSVPMACAVRHALAILRCEENDGESGLPHRGHMACNLVMLVQYESSYLEGDDRPTALRGGKPS